MSTTGAAPWREEAQRLKAERARCTSVVERIAFDNQWSQTNGLPVGILLLALESEELDHAINTALESGGPVHE